MEHNDTTVHDAVVESITELRNATEDSLPSISKNDADAVVSLHNPNGHTINANVSNISDISSVGHNATKPIPMLASPSIATLVNENILHTPEVVNDATNSDTPTGVDATDILVDSTMNTDIAKLGINYNDGDRKSASEAISSVANEPDSQQQAPQAVNAASADIVTDIPVETTIDTDIAKVGINDNDGDGKSASEAISSVANEPDSQEQAPQAVNNASSDTPPGVLISLNVNSTVTTDITVDSTINTGIVILGINDDDENGESSSETVSSVASVSVQLPITETDIVEPSLSSDDSQNAIVEKSEAQQSAKIDATRAPIKETEVVEAFSSPADSPNAIIEERMEAKDISGHQSANIHSTQAPIKETDIDAKDIAGHQPANIENHEMNDTFPPTPEIPQIPQQHLQESVACGEPTNSNEAPIKSERYIYTPDIPKAVIEAELEEALKANLRRFAANFEYFDVLFRNGQTFEVEDS
ncbi:hypothetical protein HDU76_010239 [Blyttiomyces sp. JEL0837]|nr:hypothetical protein HDU76_010239 [Blyttiomyces sp. JEL0837]